MQFKAKDGSSHSSQLKAYQHGGQDPAASNSQQSDQPRSIEDDPRARQLVDELKQMGYTGDEVKQCMDSDDGSQDQSQSQGGQAATQAAPLQIPGMQ